MSSEHPITPPPELVEQWIAQGVSRPTNTDYMMWFATQAANWGSDQELEACCEWLGDAPVVYNDNGDLHPGSYLRDARRRPKLPSLKEQALKILEEEPEADDMKELIVFDTAQVEIIRRALEALPD